MNSKSESAAHENPTANAKIEDLERQLADANSGKGQNALMAEVSRQKDLITAIFERSPAGVAVIAGQDLVIQLCNPVFRSLTPDPNREPVGRTWDEVWTYPSDLHLEDLLRSVMETGEEQHSLHHKLIYPDQSVHYYSLHCTRMSWSEDTAVLVVLWETTELVISRQEAEQAAKEARLRAAEAEDRKNRLKETLAALKESERRLQLAHAAARLGSWDWIFGDTHAHGSETFFLLHGLEPEPGGRLDLELYLSKIHPEDEQRVRDLTLKAISGTPYGEIEDNDFRYILPDGSIRWMSAYNWPIIEDNILTGITGVTMDITDRKQAEETLRESEERFRSVLENSVDIAYRYNLQAGCYDYMSPVSERVLGFTPQEINDMGDTQMLARIHPDDQAHYLVELKRVDETGKGKLDYRFKEKGGSYRWLADYVTVINSEDGQPLYRGGIIRDITERKQAEEALTESRERFRNLADAMPQLVWSSGADGVIDYYNHRLSEYDELKQDGDVDYPWVAPLHPDDLTISRDAWWHAVQTGETFQVEHRMRIADGSYRWHLSRGVPLRDDNGAVIRWYGTSTDIQDLKEAEQSIATYVKKLEDSNKELQEFAFIASHDLQEPLRKIESFSRMLLSRPDENLDDQQRDYLGRIRSAVDRMRLMIDDLLSLSRISTRGKSFELVDLNQVAAEVLSDLEDRIKVTGAKVEIDRLSSIEADPMQIHQLFQNLLGNALKFYRPEDPPRVKVWSQSPSMSQSKASSSGSQVLELFVEDNGIGFDESLVEQIFQPFQRLVGRSQFEGSGIGLAICRKIVERHGGEITASSTPGIGSTFRVVLPVTHSNKDDHKG
jgi:PAS domain S-box-containing protein